MQCLTDSEVSAWLARHEIPENPYKNRPTQAYYLQFRAPDQHRETDALARCYSEWIISESVRLVHIVDWSHYTPSDMIAVAGIRSSHTENRSLIEAPGHLIEPEEAEVGVSLFALSASFEWTAYLCTSQDRTTLLNWEGELFDFWTDSQEAFLNMRKLLADFQLAETYQSEQADEADIDKQSEFHPAKRYH